jgi:hypothetical protein
METSAQVLFPSSVILSEASGGHTFPVAVGRAESKDLGGIFWAPDIKAMLPPGQRGEAAIGNEALFRL